MGTTALALHKCKTATGLARYQSTATSTVPPLQHYNLRKLQQFCDTAALVDSYYSTVAHPVPIIG
eukprot:1171597-Pyramimonas_sp.AAC.1